MPDRLRTAITTAPVRSRVTPRLLALAAAVMVAVPIGSVTAMRLRARQATDLTAVIAAGLVDSHIRALMAEHLFDVRSTDQHMVKPWFLGRLD